jgi:Glycoside hydrolase 123, catalytic domain/Glycoside hydrolase 123 N-terminal domain
MFRTLTLVSVLVAVLLSCTSQGPGQSKQATLTGWAAPIEVKIYRGAFTRQPDNRTLAMTGLAGEVLSAQAVIRSTADIDQLSGAMGPLTGPDGAVIPAQSVRVRYCGYVPVDETMTMTADPLLEDLSVAVPANLAQPLWITVAVPAGAAPGKYEGTFTASAAPGGSVEFEVALEVLPAVLSPAPDWKFYLNIWQDPAGAGRAHGVEPWSEQHWGLLEKYAANFAAHGMKSIMTSIVEEPWHSQAGVAYPSMVKWSYPGQFKSGAADKFEWDFTIFDRYVSLMVEAGIKDKIDMYALVKGPGGTLDASILYRDSSTGEMSEVELEVGEPLWEEIWTAFLPVLKQHLEDKGWFDIAMLGFDEKPARVMKIIYNFVADHANDFKVVSSGGYPGDERKTGDEIVFPIDDLTNQDRWKNIEPLVKEMAADERYVSWYTACWPHYPNTFIFSHLRETRFIGWVTWKFGFDGYTRWAVNFYPEDIWNQPRYKWPSGDMFFVYPGQDGPLDTIRWELLRQGIQDYEALGMAMELAQKVGRNDLIEKMEKAVEQGARFDGCGLMPNAEEARAVINDVIRELGGDA